MLGKFITEECKGTEFFGFQVEDTGLIIIEFSFEMILHSDKIDTSITVGHARQQWIKTEQDLKKGIAKILRRAMPIVMKEVYKKEVSAPCLGALMGFAKALKDVKLWAYKSKYF